MKKHIIFLAFISCITSTSWATVLREKKLTVQESDLPSLYDAQYIRVGIVKANWNGGIVEPLFEDCVSELLTLGVQANNIVVANVPGSLELPYGAQELIRADLCDVCICLGAIIEGTHQLWVESIAYAVVQNISNLSLGTGIPVICGVLICTQDQAENLVKGYIGSAWARSALMMAP